MKTDLDLLDYKKTLAKEAANKLGFRGYLPQGNQQVVKQNYPEIPLMPLLTQYGFPVYDQCFFNNRANQIFEENLEQAGLLKKYNFRNKVQITFNKWFVLYPFLIIVCGLELFFAYLVITTNYESLGAVCMLSGIVFLFVLMIVLMRFALFLSGKNFQHRFHSMDLKSLKNDWVHPIVIEMALKIFDQDNSAKFEVGYFLDEAQKPASQNQFLVVQNYYSGDQKYYMKIT